VGAQAFAHGQDVYYGAGKGPGKDALTAHELTHVVQQTGRIQSQAAPGGSPDASAPIRSSTTFTRKNITGEVHGATLSLVGAAMSSSGTGEAGSVQPTLPDPLYEYDDKGEKVTKVAVTVIETKKMPVWAELGQQCQPVKDEWNRFYSALDKHEEEHVAIDRKHYTDVHKKLIGKPKEVAWAKLDAVTEAANLENEAHDLSTRHGRRDGTDINGAVQCGIEKVSTDTGLTSDTAVPESAEPEMMAKRRELTDFIQPQKILTQCEVIPEDEEEIQTKRSPDTDFQAESNLESRLNASRGGGSALPDDVRSFMEPRFGADFSQVRVHTGSDAVQMNRDVNAQAFAHGSDIYFGAGKSPGTNELTAHELTHVVQQTFGSIQTKAKETSFASTQIQRNSTVSPVFNAIKIPISYAHDFDVKQGKYIKLNKIGLKFEGNVQEESPKGATSTITFPIGGGGAGKTGSTGTSGGITISGGAEIKKHADNILAKNLENIAKELGADLDKKDVETFEKIGGEFKLNQAGGANAQGKFKYEGGLDIKLFDPAKLSFGLEFTILGFKVNAVPKPGGSPLEFQILSVSPKSGFSAKKAKAFSLFGSDFGLEGKGEVNVELEPDWLTIGETIIVDLGVGGSLSLLGSAAAISAPIVGAFASGQLTDLNMGLKLAALTGTRDVRFASLVVYKTVLMGYDCSHESLAAQKAYEEALKERQLAMGNMSLEMYQAEAMKDKSHIDVLSEQFFNRAMSSFIVEMHNKADKKMEEGIWTRFFSDKPTLHSMIDREVHHALTGM
jgi:hypothetical protein